MLVSGASSARPILNGRSSSHFTRVTRIFAAELGVDYEFRIVRDLMSTNPDDYGGNPALRVPTLRVSGSLWLGALNICRELVRQSRATKRIIWPEDVKDALLANAQELVLQAMSIEVSLIMAKVSGQDGGAHVSKLRTSLFDIMTWLENDAARALAALSPQRDLSYLEVTLFCLVTHLRFRDVLPVEPYSILNDFCRNFATRPSARETPFQFDV